GAAMYGTYEWKELRGDGTNRLYLDWPPLRRAPHGGRQCALPGRFASSRRSRSSSACCSPFSATPAFASHLPLLNCFTQLRSMFGGSPRSCAIFVTAVPGCNASFTASRLNSAVNRLLPIRHLR